MSTSRITKLALIATATAAVAIAIPATAQADPVYQIFQSPSGNIRCTLFYGSNRNGAAACTIQHSTYAVPPGQAIDCESGVGLLTWPHFALGQGDSPGLTCVFGDRNPPTWPTLDYGQKSRSFGAITCDSETSGVTCTDSSTGHFFRVSRESYDVG